MSAKYSIVFLGYNYCAEKLLDNLYKSGLVSNDKKLIIVSKNKPPNKKWIKHVRKDHYQPAVFEEIDWKVVELTIIFYESDPEMIPEKVDIKTIATAIRIPKNVKIIAEITDENYAKVIRENIPGDIELIYKERFDANLIANTIVNPGKTVDLIHELANLEGNRIDSFRLSDFTSNNSITVEELKLLLLEGVPRIFLGMTKKDKNKPILNPPNEEEIQGEDIIYCLVRGVNG